ncbi:MAG TPA: outer membrane beta-barrel protein [Puia sp.]|jgi:hypothetical protein|nr:outer membrane beta-barrel protein [Puia sp.]
MKYNNGDMDDLFRRASERYPLRTDSADWDRLASALNGEPAAPSDEAEKRRRRGVFWWFLLVPLAGIGYLTWQMGMHHSLEKSVMVTNTVGSGAGRSGNGVGATNKVDRSNNTNAGVDGNAVPAGNAVASGGGTGDGVSGGEGVRKMRTSDNKTANAGATQNSVGLERQGVVESDGIDKRRLGGGKVRILRIPAGAKSKVGSSDSAGSVGRLDDIGSTGRFSAERSTGSDLGLAALDLRRAPIGGRNGVVVNVLAPKAAEEGTDPKKPSGPSSKQHSHGYIGVFGAPDFSTVRFQTMKGVGNTFGVLLGYSFNDKWAIESGLSLDRKRYYTAGEYFKKEMPAGYTLQNVDGTCNMWEIPVNVRYNFNTSSRMRWFATAGLSTYLMSKETYTYQYEYNWTTGDSSWDIHKPSQYWFSIVNLSAGFETSVGRIGKLRLEPYVRIPLSGIGTGKLPIVSGGLNIGIVRNLW